MSFWSGFALFEPAMPRMVPTSWQKEKDSGQRKEGKRKGVCTFDKI